MLVLHGGPGAPGSATSLARALAGRHLVLETRERRRDERPLTVARHVADLDRVVDSVDPGRPALVGHSWGAMLALCYAATHPDRAGPLVLVACGTFDTAARALLQARLGLRLDDDARRRLAALPREVADPDERLARTVVLLNDAYVHGPLTGPVETGRCDARGHDESWSDMLRLQAAGVYPEAFRAIRSPVLMLHGADDPHPGRAILASLRPVLPHIEYREFPRCGHWPWLERDAREDVLATIERWVDAR